MRKLTVFNNITLDGYFSGPNGDLSWAHRGSHPEWDAFVAQNAGSGGVLLLGRKTYDLMASYWPTAQAMQANPSVAKGMNANQKIVFSRSMERAGWENTTLIKDDIVEEIRGRKQESGPGMTILGIGSIVSQFAENGLIDKYQIVVHPVALGKGKTMFEGANRLNLKLVNFRAFQNGNLLLNYTS